MSEKMLRQIRRKSKKSSPAKSDLSELELPINQRHLAQRSTDLTAHDVLQLQRLIGNHAVNELLATKDTNTTKAVGSVLQRSVVNKFMASNSLDATIQRDRYDDPEDFIAWFQERTIYKNSLSNQSGDCAPAAKAIGKFLEMMFNNDANVTVRYRAISFLSPYNMPGANNMPHFVVTLTWGVRTVVIDPTQAQFQGGVNQIAFNTNWETGFASLPTLFFDGTKLESASTPKVYADFNTFAEADNFIYECTYKTSADNKPTGKKEIGTWVTPRVPYTRPAKVVGQAAPPPTPPKKKKGFFNNLLK